MRTVVGPTGQEVTGRRVVVTAVGVLACCGIGRDAFWDGLCGPPPEGERRVPGFDPASWFGPKEARRVDRFAQLAVAAAAMAIEEAGGPDSLDADPQRAGVIMGTGVGGLETLEEQVLLCRDKGARRVSPFLVPMMMPNAGAAAISMRYGLQGPCEVVTTACAAGTHAIGNGARLVASGRCDVVLAGGSEAAMTATAVAGFGNMTALSPTGVSRPFDVDRDGFVMSEGGAVLVLEDLERARSRGATILAEVLGAASTADAHHLTAPAPGGSGAAACMELALIDAGLAPADIRQINAHGTSTPLNDAAEAEAILKVFGSPGPPVTSTKGITGHALGAAGALEASAAVLSIERGQIPPTAGVVTPDPAIGLDLVLGGTRPWQPGPVISNSFGFGGHNGCVVFGPPGD